MDYGYLFSIILYAAFLNPLGFALPLLLIFICLIAAVIALYKGLSQLWP